MRYFGLMTVSEAHQRLIEARRNRAEVTREIQFLRQFLKDRGEHPDREATPLACRNEEIFSLHLSGQSNKQIAKACNLSPARIKEICDRERYKAARLYDLWNK